MILRFKKGEKNHFIVNDKKYFVVDTGKSHYCLPAECPHRGGPLNLGVVDERKQMVTCPWHDNQYGCNLLKRGGKPLIKFKDDIAISTGVESSEGVISWLERR